MHSIMHKSEKKSWTRSILNKRGLILWEMKIKLRAVVFLRVRVHEKCDRPEIGARNREQERQTYGGDS